MKAVSGGEIGALLVTQKSGDCLASVSIWHARPPQSRWLWVPGSAHGWRRQLQAVAWVQPASQHPKNTYPEPVKLPP